MRINTNVSSLVAQEAATNTSNRITSSLEKLSTGLRINKASDDASGLAIADKLRTQATSINQGISNGNSAVSLLQIADKSMAEQSSILDTIKSKLIQANTDTTSADGRESIRKDISKLLQQLNNIASQTNYNGVSLLQNSATNTAASKALNFQVGESTKDVIANTSIQSNTEGLGSKTNYYNETTVKANNSILVTSDSSINIAGMDKSGNTTVENVTLNGKVNEITLRAGATITNADAATKTILNNTDNITYDSGSDTYSVGGITPVTINLSSVDSVSATISTPDSDYLKPTDVKVGQLIKISGSLVDNSDLKTKLNDGNLFTKLTGTKAGTSIYLAVADSKINSLQTSGNITESFKLITTTNVDSGTNSTQFNAGDIIKIQKDSAGKLLVVSGSLLDHALRDTKMFTSGGSNDGTFVVNKNYTAGALRLMEGESITVTQGQATTIDGMDPKIATSGFYSLVSSSTNKGLKLSGLVLNPAGNTSSTKPLAQADGVGNLANLNTVTGNATSGKTLFGSGEDTISFIIKATGMSSNATQSLGFTYKQGDVIKLVKDSVTGAGADASALSQGLMSTTNFVALSGGKYQALTDGTLKLDGTDRIDVTRLIGSTAEPYKVNFDITKSELKEITTNDNTISLKTGSGNTLTIKNNDTTKGDNLTLTSATDMTNGKLSLTGLADLGENELTTSLAATYETVIDDAITKLNNYRGDIGSTQNQVQSAVRNLMTQATNVQAAESIIRDVDYASESANFNKQNIIAQAGSYAISQANSVQQNVLKLLQ